MWACARGSRCAKRLETWDSPRPEVISGCELPETVLRTKLRLSGRGLFTKITNISKCRAKMSTKIQRDWQQTGKTRK